MFDSSLSNSLTVLYLNIAFTVIYYLYFVYRFTNDNFFESSETKSDKELVTCKCLPLSVISSSTYASPHAILLCFGTLKKWSLRSWAFRFKADVASLGWLMIWGGGRVIKALIKLSTKRTLILINIGVTRRNLWIGISWTIICSIS